MNYGLEQHTVDAITGVFKKYPQITCAIIYGSRAKGNYRKNSDIDITLRGEKLDLSTLYDIETTLDDLLLPYRIDLSNYDKIENDDLKDHIDRIGIAFYVKND